MVGAEHEPIVTGGGKARHLSGYVPATPLDSQPDCHPQCLSGLVFEGKNENAMPVAQMVGDTLHHFRQEVLTAQERDSIPSSVPVVYHQPQSRLKVGVHASINSASAGISRMIQVHPGDVAAPQPFVAWRPHDELRATMYHELMHAHTSPEFFQAAAAFADDMAAQVGVDRSELRQVVIESLTVALHAKRAPEDLQMQGTFAQFSNLARSSPLVVAALARTRVRASAAPGHAAC
jgi:hypothetical protein